MLRDRTILFYPIVLAAFPAVFLYAENPNARVSIPEFIGTVAITMLLTALLLLSLRLIIRDSVKVSLIVFILLVLFFSYSAVRDQLLFHGVSIAGTVVGRHRYLLPPVAVIALAGTWIALRYRGNLTPLVRGATVAALILVLFNVGRLVIGAIDLSHESPNMDQFPGLVAVPPTSIEELPDIYYIILDSYSGADALKEIHEFDNSEFIDSLERKGFFVPPRARSNYLVTKYSLQSSLQMRYLSASERELYRFDDNEVLRFVRALGYKYVHLSSGIQITKRNIYADIEILTDNPLDWLVTDFTLSLLDTTFLPPVAEVLGLPVYSTFHSEMANRFNENMRHLPDIVDIPGPTFTFNHNLPPHPPNIFDQMGNRPKDVNGPGYIDQLVYVSKRVEEAVDEILERSSTEPVIIIQADHGQSNYSGDVNNLNRLAFDAGSLILNAYYLPEYCRSSLYPTITPVNTFRLVFNECLGADFDLLEDRTYLLPGGPVVESSQIPE